jgi:hypothetical protein
MSSVAVVFAANVLDARGPGYRERSESRVALPSPGRLHELLRDHPTYRAEILDALPPTRVSPEERGRLAKRHLQRGEQFRYVPFPMHLLPASLEIQRLGPTIPAPPAPNPFAGPIRLFDTK